jgi:hypothetical protein
MSLLGEGEASDGVHRGHVLMHKTRKKKDSFCSMLGWAPLLYLRSSHYNNTITKQAQNNFETISKQFRNNSETISKQFRNNFETILKQLCSSICSISESQTCSLFREEKMTQGWVVYGGMRHAEPQREMFSRSYIVYHTSILIFAHFSRMYKLHVVLQE